MFAPSMTAPAASGKPEAPNDTDISPFAYAAQPAGTSNGEAPPATSADLELPMDLMEGLDWQGSGDLSLLDPEMISQFLTSPLPSIQGAAALAHSPNGIGPRNGGAPAPPVSMSSIDLPEIMDLIKQS